MGDDLRCCEQARLVYDCPGPCGRRVYEEMGNVYAALRTCEECYRDTPHRPNTFPSQMDLVGAWCSEHGWNPPPHLVARQGTLLQ